MLHKENMMKLQLSGFVFLLGYIVMVGVASFLEKFSMKQLNPYQVNFLMAIGMAITAVPALWIKQGSLIVPIKALPLGAPIGLLMALGSICFVLALAKLPVGIAAAISTSYVLLVVFLSWLFLNESLTWIKTAGIALTITGVALLSWHK
jgi:drug/metabolite transporter (DMT)-like permease